MIFGNSVIFLFLITGLCLSVWCYQDKDEFHEELMIKPLASGHVYSYFQFTTLWNKFHPHHIFDHCHLFPPPLGELIDRFNVRELHISLTEGLWRHEGWGYPVLDAPPGAELWVWFKPGTQNIDKNWKELNGALSGLLCASLNFIDSSNSMSPEMSFRPMGIEDPEQPLNSTLLRYGTLPREIVCTENLTPWKKLLPCDAKRGLATLLNAGYIHNTNYHSLGVHFRHICMNKECTETGLELRQTVSLVYDLVILGGSSPDWSIRKLFGLGLAGHCPLASTSTIYIDITSNQTGQTFRLSPLPDRTVVSHRGGHQTELAVYNVQNLDPDSMFNIALVHDKPRIFTQNIAPAIFANRYIVGYGQEFGGIVTKVHNRHWQPITIIFLENIPWFVPVYFHTLKIVSQGRTITPLVKRYVPGRERQRPYYLEIMVELPARSVTDISVQFDYVFLKWQEYPPDANHGFYIGSAVITAWLPVARNLTGLPQDGSLISSCINASRDGYMVRLRTESLIITLPTPDFSMPYNVICLACTVVALAFGPLHNITTKKLQLTKAGEPRGVFALFANRSAKFFVTLGLVAAASIFTLRHFNIIVF
ncbi:LOW QUALITY PROTEIN: GPI transamidase component PIG-T-like [Homalodisca vitripennis]|nr:LOW QUALITY PROTEIN: GPI transamidase component PIG-T-like [Homalodisca vitripennis]